MSDNLIPREILFQTNIKMQSKDAQKNIAISPDGNWLAYQCLINNEIKIFQIGQQQTTLQAIPLEIPEDFIISQIDWCYSNKYLLVLVEKPDTRQPHDITASNIYIINREDKSITQPVQIQSARFARLVKLNSTKPNEIMFCANFINELNTQVTTSLYRYDLEKQDIIIDAMSFGQNINNFVVDDNFRIHYYYTHNRNIEHLGDLTLTIFANTDINRDTEQFAPTFESIFSATSSYAMGKIKIAGYTADYSGIYILDPRGKSNYNALKLLNTQTTDYTTIYSLPDKNIAGVLFSNLYEATGEIIGYISNTAIPDIHLTDAGAKLYPLLSTIVEQAKKATIAIGRPRSFSMLVNRTLTHFILPNITEKDKYNIVKLEDSQNLKYSIQDTFEINELYDGNTEVAIVTARDGLKLPCYLVTPVKHNQQPMPCVVMVHGGPSARDKWSYRADAQFLANRGIATLMVNFRGSTKFGKEHFDKGNGQWASGILNDIEDATQYFIKLGKIDETSLVIAGFSFGGYATLAMLTMRPGLFKAGITGAGFTDLNLDLESKKSSLQNYKYWRDLMLGPIKYNQAEENQALRHASPITYVEKLTVPLLMISPEKDSVVPYEQTTLFAEALTAAKKPFTLVKIKDTDHQILHMIDCQTTTALVENFLGCHLGTPYQPIGDDIKNAPKFEVICGGELIPGLIDAQISTASTTITTPSAPMLTQFNSTAQVSGDEFGGINTNDTIIKPAPIKEIKIYQ